MEVAIVEISENGGKIGASGGFRHKLFSLPVVDSPGMVFKSGNMSMVVFLRLNSTNNISGPVGK